MTDASGADLPTGPAMNPHVTEFLRNSRLSEPADYGGRRAPSPAALLRAAARRARYRVAQVDTHVYVFSDGRGPAGGFSIPLTSAPSAQAYEASKSLPLTKKYLTLAGIPVPPGTDIPADRFELGMQHFRGMERPAVVKPSSSERGAGITSRVTSESEFQQAWKAATSIAKSETEEVPRVLIEEQVEGLDVRAFIVGENVVAALARVPHFFIGDGVTTIRDRIAEADVSRNEHPLLGRFPHDSEGFARSAAFNLDELSEEERVYPLSSAVNMRKGGLTIDVTSALSRDVKELAISALWALPGGQAGEVDLILPSMGSIREARVLHVDVRAEFTPYHYPWAGSGKQVAGALIQRMSDSSRGR